MSDRQGGNFSTTISVADARGMARELGEREGLPPGFDLPELAWEMGGEVTYGARQSGLVIADDESFEIRVAQREGTRARETAAELFAMFFFLAMSASGKLTAVALPWSKPTPTMLQAASAFARELLVPGKQLRNLIAFYGFDMALMRQDDLDFLAGLFEVQRPLLEVRFVELGLVPLRATSGPKGASEAGRGAGGQTRGRS